MEWSLFIYLFIWNCNYNLFILFSVCKRIPFDCWDYCTIFKWPKKNYKQQCLMFKDNLQQIIKQIIKWWVGSWSLSIKKSRYTSETNHTLMVIGFIKFLHLSICWWESKWLMNQWTNLKIEKKWINNAIQLKYNNQRRRTCE